MKYQKCPVCDGTGLVSRPPGVTGDVTCWVDSVTSHICPHCNGARVIVEPNLEYSELQTKYNATVEFANAKHGCDDCEKLANIKAILESEQDCIQKLHSRLSKLRVHFALIRNCSLYPEHCGHCGVTDCKLYHINDGESETKNDGKHNPVAPKDRQCGNCAKFKVECPCPDSRIWGEKDWCGGWTAKKVKK